MGHDNPNNQEVTINLNINLPDLPKVISIFQDIASSLKSIAANKATTGEINAVLNAELVRLQKLTKGE